MGRQSHQQDHPLLEVLLLGNLSWEAPFLDPPVLASEQVSMRLPLVAPAGHPALPVVPVAPVGPVLLAQRELEHQVDPPAVQAASRQEPELLAVGAQENHGPLLPRRLQQSGLESLAAYLH